MLLEAIDIEKTFGSVCALRGVSLKLRPSSVHAVLGENGAGKSTLMKIFSGVYAPTGGRLVVKGREVNWTHAEQARASGVSTIFQEFILLPNLSVAENLFLGHEPRRWHGGIDRKRMESESRKVLEPLGLNLDPATLVGQLRVADQQMIEIAKGVMRDSDIFVFDEPTAALGEREAEQLFRLVRELKSRGKGILYISHRIPELFDLCDEVTVLKDGQFAGNFPMSGIAPERLIATMVGRELDQLYPRRTGNTGDAALELKDVSAAGLAGPVNLSVGRNEIVGLAGLEGQGQIDITRAIFEGRALTRGSISLFGEELPRSGSPQDGVRAGIGLVPEDRKSEGLFPVLGTDRNISAGQLSGMAMLSPAPASSALVARQIKALKIRLDRPSQAIGELSGGNQQKALLGRWLGRGVRLLICEEPTRGVDIGAKSEIYHLLRELADSGVPVLVTSRELPELIGLCDRIVVVRDQRTVGSVNGVTATEENVMHAAVTGEIA